MMYLRHEAGHAINYAYRLWRRSGWRETFGAFSKPYKSRFRPDVLSREYVRHLKTDLYGRAYAQKHPDEDFAETFAVWLMPRSDWRRRYRLWPALQKLRYIDTLVRDIRGTLPRVRTGELSSPVETMNVRLAKFYGTRAQRYRRAARWFVDDKLREIFPPLRVMNTASAADLLREYHREILSRIVRWTGLNEDEVATILAKLRSRASSLDLRYRKSRRTQKLMDLTALGTSMGLDYFYMGRLTG
jgi:hypothetical protein